MIKWYCIYHLGITAILSRVPIFYQPKKYLDNWLTWCGLFPFYSKMGETDKRSGVDTRCLIGYWQLFEQTYQYEFQRDINASNRGVTTGLLKQNKSISEWNVICHMFVPPEWLLVGFSMGLECSISTHSSQWLFNFMSPSVGHLSVLLHK